MRPACGHRSLLPNNAVATRRQILGGGAIIQARDSHLSVEETYNVVAA